MKIRNFFNISRRALAVLLCLCMALTAMALVSCNSTEDTENNAAPESTDEVAEVLRLVNDVAAGTKLTEADVETVSLRKVDIPISAITSKDDVVGKYAASNLFKGDLLFPAKLSDTDPSTVEDNKSSIDEEQAIEYTLISEYASLVKDGDYTAAINKAIEENPGKAIYFPDGTYKISDTIVVSADAKASVSFRLSNYATIKAVNWSDKTKPMIRMGVEPETPSDDIFAESNVYIKGGVIDAAGAATGITIEGGRDIILSNVTVKDAYCGINLKCADNSLGATYADIENVAVVGNGEKGSIGVLVEGSYNNLTNLKISDVQYAVKCTATGSDNIFKSIMAIGTGLGTDTDNAGFWDMSGGNE